LLESFLEFICKLGGLPRLVIPQTQILVINGFCFGVLFALAPLRPAARPRFADLYKNLFADLCKMISFVMFLNNFPNLICFANDVLNSGF